MNEWVKTEKGGTRAQEKRKEREDYLFLQHLSSSSFLRNNCLRNNC
jgi:hypothetical protein